MNAATIPTLLAVLAASFACADSNAKNTPPPAPLSQAAPAAPTTTPTPTSDEPVPAIAPWRSELLDLAFDAASAFPLNPHIKNRSRAQADVVVAALEIDQPDLALSCAKNIANWRQGEAIASIAYHQAEQGRLARVHELLAAAQKIADAGGVTTDEKLPSDGIETTQEWRSDRIRARIASTYVLLGQNNLADAAAFGADASETAPIQAERSRKISGEHFDEHMTRLDALVATGSFDALGSALGSYAELFARFYDDVERRAKIEEKIHVAWAKLPIQVRIEVQERLVDTAIDADDEKKALELLDSASAMLVGTNWTVEDDVPLRAKLAALRARAGDVDTARADADAALASYDGGRERIVNIYRARVLRPLAEAYVAIGDFEKARTMYARTIEEGALNPNSRPRCDDLVATVCSMVVRDVEPDAALRSRIAEIRSKLGQPW